MAPTTAPTAPPPAAPTAAPAAVPSEPPTAVPTPWLSHSSAWVDLGPHRRKVRSWKEKKSKCSTEGDLWILHVNLDGFKTNAVHVEAQIHLMDRAPDIIFLNETKLDEGDPDKKITITGYVLISRRDRASKNKGGGIAVFVLERKVGSIFEVEKSKVSERAWIMAHTNDGPFLLGCWYRPPKRGNLDGIAELREEVELLRMDAVGVVVIGDVNVHSKNWLRFSDGETPEGHLLREVSEGLGLKQIVTEPTRKHHTGADHLLDLTLTDTPTIKTIVGAKVRDHRYTVTKLNVEVPSSIKIQRSVWKYSKADWTRLKENLSDFNWDILLAMDSDEAAETITKIVLDLAEECIGHKDLQEVKSTHPWLTDEIIKLTEERRKAEGSEIEKEIALKCSQKILEARAKYIQRTRL